MSSTTYRAWDHKAWSEAGLKNYEDFGHCIEFVNQSEYGDSQLEGEWWYDDDAALTIYWGTFGNYNSPGSSHDTYADVYEDIVSYTAAKAEWEAKPEYLEDEDEEEEEEFEVIVGNVGTVYSGQDRERAEEVFNNYKGQSQNGIGRAAGEPVSFLCNSEIEEEYAPEEEESEDEDDPDDNDTSKDDEEEDEETDENGDDEENDEDEEDDRPPESEVGCPDARMIAGYAHEWLPGETEDDMNLIVHTPTFNERPIRIKVIDGLPHLVFWSPEGQCYLAQTCVSLGVPV